MQASSLTKPHTPLHGYTVSNRYIQAERLCVTKQDSCSVMGMSKDLKGR